jgi:hypothetical protein
MIRKAALTAAWILGSTFIEPGDDPASNVAAIWLTTVASSCMMTPLQKKFDRALG